MEDEQNNLEQTIRQVEAEDRPWSQKNGKKVINHVKIANDMVKMICMSPVHDLIKRIMILRIGSPLMNQKPLSHLGIALRLGLKENEVFRLEREGIGIVTEFMERVCVQDAVGAFNKEAKVNDVKNIISDGHRPELGQT